MALLTLVCVSKAFGYGLSASLILNNLDFSINTGEIIAIIGSSGSGKSTLLHILGLIDAPTSGTIMLGDNNCSALSDCEMTVLRRDNIGFIYQFHHLLPEFTAIENLQIAVSIKEGSHSIEKCLNLLKSFDLLDKANYYPHQLSGGEKQRVAVARAIINDPQIILADEPTGNLDNDNALIVLDMLINAAKERGISSIIVTHDIELAKKADKVFVLRNKRLELL